MAPGTRAAGRGDLRRPQGFAEFMALWTENFDDWEVRLKDVRGEGDRVVAFAHQHGVGKVSGAPVDMDFAMAFTMRDGQVTDVRAFLDDNEALSAAGLGYLDARGPSTVLTLKRRRAARGRPSVKRRFAAAT